MVLEMRNCGHNFSLSCTRIIISSTHCYHRVSLLSLYATNKLFKINPFDNLDALSMAFIFNQTDAVNYILKYETFDVFIDNPWKYYIIAVAYDRLDIINLMYDSKHLLLDKTDWEIVLMTAVMYNHPDITNNWFLSFHSNHNRGKYLPKILLFISCFYGHKNLIERFLLDGAKLDDLGNIIKNMSPINLF